HLGAASPQGPVVVDPGKARAIPIMGFASIDLLRAPFTEFSQIFLSFCNPGPLVWRTYIVPTTVLAFRGIDS
ncbi:hypothetical protein MYX64_11525, partial [Nitrospinae bacterium AH_259_B05_G02_I21]|nr:hypothetical protein [Nitrospinae bacterium AH_259_B05_G02_I21]